MDCPWKGFPGRTEAARLTSVRDLVTQRAIGFEPTTSSLGEIHGENVNRITTRTNVLTRKKLLYEFWTASRTDSGLFPELI